MQVYLHNNFWFLADLVPYTCHFFDHIDQVPKDCDFVAYCNYDNKNIDQEVELLCSRSKTVFFDWNEFVQEDFVERELELHQKYPNLNIVASVVPNYQSRLLFSGFWFMVERNYYSECNPRFWAEKALQSLKRTEHRSYIVDCLLGRQSLSRDFIKSRYQQLSVQKQQCIIWSYWRDDIRKGIWDVDASKLVRSSELITMYDPLTHDVDNVALSALLPVDIYNNSWFSVVADSVVHNSYSFFTEKIAKPILAGRLFVCFVGQHFLRNIRNLGFKTFHGIIDESYDAIDDPIERWDAAWLQIRYLLDSDPVIIHRQVQDIVQHNQQHFRRTDWLNQIKHCALPLLLR